MECWSFYRAWKRSLTPEHIRLLPHVYPTWLTSSLHLLTHGAHRVTRSAFDLRTSRGCHSLRLSVTFRRPVSTLGDVGLTVHGTAARQSRKGRITTRGANMVHTASGAPFFRVSYSKKHKLSRLGVASLLATSVLAAVPVGHARTTQIQI